ncbi:hypothetical protein HPB48_022966 [Haemaphysalis longicornis]|uniref:Uncharacterized protein n=1 Tax=Haemaphysalis longicornis TaxID=44386 RepID=A0A9J6FWP5_HAELO|nr:hypothetical protein HPB48_022966 [Haemaphysalis longicornis]
MVATTRAGSEKAGANRRMDDENSGGASNTENPRDAVVTDEDNAVTLQQTADNAAVARETTTPAPADVQQLTIKVLELQLELERLKQRGSGERECDGRFKLGRYAEEMRAVLAPMPDSDDLVPAWFRSAENMLNNRVIPDDARGPIIVPFLNERCRMLIANKPGSGVLSFEEVRDYVLAELKLTPDEYRRRFYACRKGTETWGQFVTKLETTLDYYLRSRKIKTIDELKELLVADRAKTLMSEQVRTYVLQQETGDWLRPKDAARLAEKYEDSKLGHHLPNQNPEVGEKKGVRSRKT